MSPWMLWISIVLVIAGAVVFLSANPWIRYVARDAFTRAAASLIRRGLGREPDFIIGGVENAYLLRWWLIPRNRFLNVYLHCFLRNDDDRALHDHPWAWCSILLEGGYIEHTIAAGGIHRRRLRTAPSIKAARPSVAHRVELLPIETPHGPAASLRPCWTLFITGPRVREWGFHCPEEGWVHWQKFTDPGDQGLIGPGCAAANDNTPAGDRKGVA